MAPGCGDLGGATAMDQGDGEIAEGSQNLRGGCRCASGSDLP